MSKQTLAIALCRVSSLEQLESQSLNHQRDNVLRAADELGVTIPPDGIWSGHVSSKKGVNYGRKDLAEMLEYCKKNKQVKYLLVQEVDRFMRSPDEQVYFQVKFMNEVGVKIWYADKPELNKDDIYAGLMRYMEGFRAAGSNDERQRKSINGQTKAIQEGRFPFSPKPGYRKGHQTGIQEVHETKGPALKKVLIRLASRLSTPATALVELNNSDFMIGHAKYKMDKFRKIATDPFYAGILEIDKQVKVRNENGLHEPLITKKQHYELLEIMNNKHKNQSGPRKNGNPKYPCNNIVTCELCKNHRIGRLVGFDHSNGKANSRIWEKYRCRSCGRYTTRLELHTEIQQQFDRNPITPQGWGDLIQALDIVWHEREGQAEQEIVRLKHKYAQLENIIMNQVEAAMDPNNASIKEEILTVIAKRKAELKEVENRIETTQTEAYDDKEVFLNFAFNFIHEMGRNFLVISPENRERCKQVVFPAGFYLDANKKVYTPEISELYRLATNKKDPSKLEKSLLVRVQGL